MPSVSKAQQHLMQAAEHGADFPMAKKLRQSMSHDQLHDFAVGSEEHKPEHVAHHSPPASYPTQILRGFTTGVIGSNTSKLKGAGMSEFNATKQAIKNANKPNTHPNRHLNLGPYLHEKKG